jgi:hypothetical protein
MQLAHNHSRWRESVNQTKARSIKMKLRTIKDRGCVWYIQWYRTGRTNGINIWVISQHFVLYIVWWTMDNKINVMTRLPKYSMQYIVCYSINKKSNSMLQRWENVKMDDWSHKIRED